MGYHLIKINPNCVNNLAIQPLIIASNLITIHNNNQEKIFEIDQDGNIYFGKDRIKIDSEKELALGFILVISDLTGVPFSNGNKDEFIAKMIQYYRERQLNKIL